MKKVSHIFVYVGFFLYFCKLIICMPQQNTPYNQPQPMGGMPPQGMPMGPMMPPLFRRKRTWKERVLGQLLPDGNGLYIVGGVRDNVVPGWLVGRLFVAFLFTFLAISIYWFRFVMPTPFMMVSLTSVALFCLLSYVLSFRWRREHLRLFKRHVFLGGLLIRLAWIVYIYFFNISYFGAPIGDAADTGFFVSMGNEIADGIVNVDFSAQRRYLANESLAFDDLAYPITLGIVYLLTGGISDVFLPFLYKAFMGAAMAVFAYNIANRHFGENVARITAIFCMLNPNMIYWCGSMMKETDMVFFTMLYVDVMDRTLMGKKLTLEAIIPAALIGMWVFLYRAALGAVCFLALLATIVMASNRVIANGKKMIIGLLVVVVLALGLGQKMISQTKTMAANVESGGQQANMEWRSARAGGNAFAKYAGAAVFAPLIFTIPFPTISMANPDQHSQMQMSGGNYIKNVLSFFTIVGLIILLLTGEWRKHVFPMAFIIGYLLVLVMSGYAQSGRFHMPIWPMLMLFAAYGLCVLPKRKEKRWFTYVLLLEVVVCFAWQWFKLKGRGMI